MGKKVRFIRAGRVEDVPAGFSKLVWADDRSVLLAHWRGRIFAFVPICPHQNNPLEGARVWDGQLECPWHHFRYDLRTGKNLYPKNVYPLGAGDMDEVRLEADIRSLTTYPVDIRNGEIFVGL